MQPALFVNPQFNAGGQNQSAAICGAALAAGYDALKGVDPAIFVWGVGLSPRGNDNAEARVEHVVDLAGRCLRRLGQWYRASGRTEPLMDGFDFHPYPIPQSLPFATGYDDRTNAASRTSPRIYQAFYDGFNGTPQPTIGQQAGGGLPVSLNEVGIQTDTRGRARLTGDGVHDRRPRTCGRRRRRATGYARQLTHGVRWLRRSSSTRRALRRRRSRRLQHFKLVDGRHSTGWQSGLFDQGYVALSTASRELRATLAGERVEPARRRARVPSSRRRDPASGSRSAQTASQADREGRRAKQGARSEGRPEAEG